VRKSAGINAQRGDQVVVTNMPFRKVEAEEAEAPSLKERVETFTPIFGYVAIAGVIIFILLFIVRPLITNITKAAPPFRQLPGARLPVGIPGETQAEQYARQVAEEMQSTEGRALTEPEIVKQMARADSRQFADILRNWIK
jgi:flagellar M-ring protein FliF